MRKILLLSTALTLGTLAPATAGGPVVIEEETEVVAERPASSAGLVIPLLLLAVVALAASGGSDEPTKEEPLPISDRRLKHDIRRVGTNQLGLGVYQYRYNGMDGLWEGVMADEVAVLHPGAIRPMLGYRTVDYRKLGLELKRVA